MVYPVWPAPTATVSPLVSKLKVIAVAAPGFAPMLLVQVRTTAAPAAQASVRVAVRIVFVPVTAVSPPPLTTLAVPAQVEVQAVLASAAQIAVLAVSLMVPEARLGFWVVKVNAMLVGVLSGPRLLATALPQVALPLLMVYPVWPAPTGTMSPLVSKLKVIAVAAPGFAPMLLVQVRTTAAPAAQASVRVAVRIVFVPVTAVSAPPLTTLAVPAQVEVQAVLASAAQIAELAVSLMVPEAAMGFWVVNVSLMLAGEAPLVTLLITTLPQVALPLLMVYPVWPAPTATVSPLVSKLKVIAVAAPGFAPML